MTLKRTIFLAIISAMAFSFSACSEKDDTQEEYPDWQNANDTYFNNKYNAANAAIASGDSSEWHIFRNWTYTTSVSVDKNIIVEVLKSGTGTTSPISTDTVCVSYQGRLIPSTTYTSGYIFDSTYSGVFDPKTAATVKFGVMSVVDGFTTALQRMHVGDRWRIYIPYTLGYGATAQSSIPAYSTLIFDVYLASYHHKGSTVSIYK